MKTLVMGTGRAGWVTGDIIASESDPNRGKWLTVWGSAYRSPVLHSLRCEAVASGQRGESVAQVTEYPMPGASAGYCYKIAPGTLSDRSKPQPEITEVGGKFYTPAIICGSCQYMTPATFSRPISCPACPESPVMRETCLTSEQYRHALDRWLASLETPRKSCSCGKAWADEPGHDNDQETATA